MRTLDEVLSNVLKNVKKLNSINYKYSLVVESNPYVITCELKYYSLVTTVYSLELIDASTSSQFSIDYYRVNGKNLFRVNENTINNTNVLMTIKECLSKYLGLKISTLSDLDKTEVPTYGS